MNRDHRLAFRRPHQEFSTEKMTNLEQQILMSQGIVSTSEHFATIPTTHIEAPENRVAELSSTVTNLILTPANSNEEYARDLPPETTAIHTLANVAEAARNNVSIPELQYNNSDNTVQIPDLNNPRTHHANNSEENVPIWRPGTIEKAMCAAVLANMGGSNAIKENLDNFLKPASELQSVVPKGLNLHCSLICPVSKNDPYEEGSRLYSLVSRLFHVAHHTARRGSTIIGQALREAFLMAHRVALGRFYSENGRGISYEIPELELTSCLPNRDSPENSPLAPAQYTVFEHTIMEKIGNSGVNSTAESYSKLFTKSWELRRRKLCLSGRITYAHIYTHGYETQSYSSMVTIRILPYCSL